ncbi:MAG: nucleoside-diphosphate sugar epimerase/dehydratase [Gammaproteobacteria bacterium]|nr:nucleoside-diphosphate sugar epimerase/dehydratase [Gammaproteobacteria bacterium]
MGLTSAEKRINSLRRHLIDLPRPFKRAVMMASDFLIVPMALWLSFAMRHGEPLPASLREHWWLLLVLPAVSVVAFHFTGMYRSVIRYLGVTVAMSVLKGVLASTLLLTALVAVAQVEPFSRTLYFLFPVFLASGLGGARLIARLCLLDPLRARLGREAVIIYGAGMAGIQLCSMLEHGGQFRVVAFVDDDSSAAGTDIRGIPVFSASRLERLIEIHEVTQVLLALPSAARQRRQQIVESLEQFPVHVRTIPGLVDIVSGRAKVDELREVEIEDVLGRDAVPPDETLLEDCIAGQRIMVTGAGGSIGSELCRQVLNRRPACLILYEISEFGLYRIERELSRFACRQDIEVEIVPVLGNVLDRARLDETLRRHAPTTVYHAAAYKHVPLVEANPVEGIRNNVLGTLRTVQAAQAAGVGRFVLISTDKAVNPTNVMGASKRIAELILQGLTAAGGPTCMCMVRFGNVLDSSGSVVPLFREQIRSGGPVTVTHPDIIRYFMTLSEASQLVLQAGAMWRGRGRLRPRHGRAGPDHGPGAPHDPPQRSERARRREPGRRDRDRDHRPASRREALRGAAHRRRRVALRASDDHACAGNQLRLAGTREASVHPGVTLREPGHGRHSQAAGRPGRRLPECR